MLNIKQIDKLFSILRRNNIIFLCKQLGANYLTSEELKVLKGYGVNPSTFYKKKGDMLLNSFYFGLLSDILGRDSKTATFEQLQEHFERGEYIPLTETENYTLDSIKKQFLGDVKAHEGKIFRDVNNIIDEKEKDNRVAYEKVIRDEIKTGLIEKKTRAQIASGISRKTGDWNRDFTKVVEYVSHLALSEGRAALVERKSGADALVYMQVYKGACKHCIRLYLTNGVGSKPGIFKLSELKSNGSNIGRKVAEWKAVIPPIHVHCRCNLHEVPEGYEWDEGTKTFSKLRKKEPIEMKRKPIRVSFGEKTYSV